MLIVHSPPKGHVDISSAGDHLGSAAIFDAIEAKRPRLAVCGHIHERWGAESTVGPTRIVNLGPAGTWFDLEPLGPRNDEDATGMLSRRAQSTPQVGDVLVFRETASCRPLMCGKLRTDAA